MCSVLQLEKKNECLKEIFPRNIYSQFIRNIPFFMLNSDFVQNIKFVEIIVLNNNKKEYVYHEELLVFSIVQHFFYYSC